MLPLNLPQFAPKISEKNGKSFIYDPLRRKYVALTPEEWVRQHFVHFLVTEKNYPANLLANEVSISMNGLSRRCDTVLYNVYLEPQIIIEYKAQYVKITQDVFEQVAHYNIPLRVRFLIVSNGMEHYCCEINYETQSFVYLKEIPAYGQVIAGKE